ncbi:hypothetical protein NP493_1840g00010 [Ridgeia piscesae]|uniref:Uncharacterized protein n=1 Tax=Ridgeia piscesae TaxID=27915 RepID=A0AAD9N8F0_RIDPI|nr:hypothetical protein NP493_1840g00010 [Ridgeia piscesae]
MLSVSVCPTDCESCYLEGTTSKCLLSGCKHGYTPKSDGTCAECPGGCAECSESGDEIVCDKCLSLTHVEVAASKSECVACHSGCKECTLDISSNQVVCVCVSACHSGCKECTLDISSNQVVSNCLECSVTDTGAICNDRKCDSGFAQNPTGMTCVGK